MVIHGKLEKILKLVLQMIITSKKLNYITIALYRYNNSYGLEKNVAGHVAFGCYTLNDKRFSVGKIYK